MPYFRKCLLQIDGISLAFSPLLVCEAREFLDEQNKIRNSEEFLAGTPAQRNTLVNEKLWNPLMLKSLNRANPANQFTRESLDTEFDAVLIDKIRNAICAEGGIVLGSVESGETKAP